MFVFVLVFCSLCHYVCLLIVGCMELFILISNSIYLSHELLYVSEQMLERKDH